MTERSGGLRIEVVEPERLHDLRRRVLRRGDPNARVVGPHDAEENTLHLAGVLDGEVVVCASFCALAFDREPGRRAYQLRFMATDPRFQGRGYGALVLAEGESRLAARGAELVWANGRDSALGFYRAAGWRAVAGSEFLSDETGIAHTVIHKTLAPSGRPGGSPRVPLVLNPCGVSWPS